MATANTYLQSIIAELEKVPLQAGLLAGEVAYREALERTVADSGQALANWHLEASQGAADKIALQILWGYETKTSDVTAVAPVGDKGSEGENRESVLIMMEEGLAIALASAPADADTVTVYNPITPGTPGFHPGDDSGYEAASIAEAGNGIEELALAAVYEKFNGK